MTWEKGQSGNLNGRPKVYGDVRELARAHTGEAVECLVTIMNDAKAAPSARTAAASAILDRGWGRPEQTLSASVTGESYLDALRLINAEIDQEAEKALPAPIDE